MKEVLVEASPEPAGTHLPTGSVTLLFSDIEGSTERWRLYPESMKAALRKHDALLSEAVAQHHGHVFKTIGDAFCTVFDRAEDAVAAAVAAQAALAAADWSAVGGLPVRMALHTGVADERQNDYFGTTVNRVARLLSAAHGRQILISDEGARALGKRRPPNVALRDLGRHRLKDFPDLAVIHQVVADGLPLDFPPLRSIAERPTNQPAELITLIGREADVAEIKTLSKKHRVLSIAGAGGIGKTSIALRVGADVLPDFEDGVWLVELAALTSGSEVSTAIAGVFGMTNATGTLLDALVSYLKNKTALLIVDNCEHLAGAVASDLTVILRSCPGIRLVATTREPLGIAGECVYRLPSLALPSENLQTAEEIGSFGSVALFVERAQMHAPGFALTDENAPVIAQICRRLDGIALAIELAASRLRVLPVEQLERRLDERFRILTGGSRAALPRQQTMRALIDWSYDLLTDLERTLFSRLAIFAAGCTLGAAIEVCGDEQLQAWELLDYLTSLVDKSLVVFEPTLGEGRYRLLESTREYARERLDQNGDRDAVAARHLQYYSALAEVADKKWSDTPAKQWIAPLKIELDNFRAALNWSISQNGNVLEGVTLLGRLEAFWWDAQPIEGRRWIAEAVPHLPQLGAPHAIAKFWLTAANVALTLRQQKDALTAADRALEAYASLADETGVAAALRCRGAALINLGNIDEGEACVQTALETFRTTGNRRLTALALRSLGLAPRLRGNIASAAPIQREALELARALEDERGIQIMSGNLAEVECDSGNYEEAVRLSSQALDIARSRHDSIFVCGALINVSAYLIALHRFDEARTAAYEAIEVAREIQSELHLAIAVQHVAVLLQHAGDNRRSARLLGYADAAFERAESKREPTEAREYDGCLHRLSETVPPEDLQRHLADGSRLDQEAARAEALA